MIARMVHSIEMTRAAAENSSRGLAHRCPTIHECSIQVAGKLWLAWAVMVDCPPRLRPTNEQLANLAEGLAMVAKHERDVD